MDPKQAANAVIAGLAVLLGYGLWRGITFFRLYWVVWLLFAALIASAVAQGLGIAANFEQGNLLAIAVSLAGWASNPTMWRAEVGRDMERGPLYARFAPKDFLTWQGWLKIVDRMGARSAALIYLAVFVLLIAAAALTVQPPTPESDRTALQVALLPAAVFALLSAWYLYRGARRLVPGA